MKISARGSQDKSMHANHVAVVTAQTHVRQKGIVLKVVDSSK